MLSELHISNLAVIEDVKIELAGGLNVFTGQTGAGKSLVLGAFEVLLGLRSAGDMLRPGAEEGRVSGMFEVVGERNVVALSAIADQSVQPGEPLLVTRKLFASGRSSFSINGQPATSGMVKRLGQALVDIHGQHDHQYLLRPSNQLEILDDFAGCSEPRRAFAQAHHDLRERRERRETLMASRTLRTQQLDLYVFQAEEIDSAGLTEGEFAELQARHAVLSNVTKIQAQASGVQAALYETEGSVVARLEMMTHVLQGLTELDETLSPLAEQVRGATLGLQEAAFELTRYLDRLEADPGELAEVEDRLNLLNRLVQKYGDATPGEDPVASVLAYREQIGAEIASLREQDHDLSQIDREIAELEARLAEIGTSLTTARAKAAKKLKPLVEAQLQELGMADAKFTFDIQPSEDPGASGMDTVEIVVQTNPGQAFRPLRQIASGGELSRVMLAIKSILAGPDRISVLVFDEVDANIGGRLGSVIGRKLRELACAPRTGGRQVLCITHLPQIAAFGDRHLRITKRVVGRGGRKQARTEVTRLEGKARIEELAEMMAGKQVTGVSRKQAEELIAAATA